MARAGALIRRITRRMIGRNGTTVIDRHVAASPRSQAIKAQHADRAARDAYRAVDSFTAAMEQAMKGQHGQARG